MCDLLGLFGGPYICVGFTRSVWRTLHLCGIYWVYLVDPTSVWDLPGTFDLIYAYVTGGREGGEVLGGTFKQDR